MCVYKMSVMDQLMHTEDSADSLYAGTSSKFSQYREQSFRATPAGSGIHLPCFNRSVKWQKNYFMTIWNSSTK